MWGWLALHLYANIMERSIQPNSFQNFVRVPLQVGCSKFRYKSDIKSARIQLVKLLTFNTLYCEIVL